MSDTELHDDDSQLYQAITLLKGLSMFNARAESAKEISSAETEHESPKALDDDK